MKTKQRRKFLQSLGVGLALPYVKTDTTFLGGTNSTSRLPEHPSETEESYWELVKSQFKFSDGLRYFNNASLGGCPLSVQLKTTAAREMLDGFPSKYMWGDWDDEKEIIRKKVAKFLSVGAEEIALIHNTTEGMNLIARSFDLKEGDEIILADHEHTSGTICWEVFQESRGVKIVRPELPLLPKSIEEVVAAYRKAITPKTKIISMCHIVNTNGMILPVKQVSLMAHERNILVAVDGAQAPGMLDVDLKKMGCDFYTASAHKWLFAPKGTGILYANSSSQHHLKPLIVCRGHNNTSIRRLENYNTRNLPEILGLGAAIDFCNQIGKDEIHRRSYELKKYFRSKLENNSAFKLKSPVSDNLSAAIQVVEIINQDVREVKEQLFEKYQIDCRPMSTFGLNALRISLAIYITKEDIDYLVDAMTSISKNTE